MKFDEIMHFADAITCVQHILDIHDRALLELRNDNITISPSDPHFLYLLEKGRICPFVDKTTIGQYTGLKDKNGVKIYEFDRVKVTYIEFDVEKEEICDVKWSEGKAGFVPWTWEEECGGCEYRLEILEVEVVGSIFDKE